MEAAPQGSCYCRVLLAGHDAYRLLLGPLLMCEGGRLSLCPPAVGGEARRACWPRGVQAGGEGQRALLPLGRWRPLWQQWQQQGQPWPLRHLRLQHRPLWRHLQLTPLG